MAGKNLAMVLTPVGLAAQGEVHLYTADTRFSVEQLGSSGPAAKAAPTGLFAAASRKMGTAASTRLLVSDVGWNLTAVIDYPKTEFAQRVCARLTSIAEEIWGKERSPGSMSRSPSDTTVD